MNNAGKWKQGQSGNPKGRPRKERALTRLLENAGRSKLGDSIETAQRLLVRRVWEGVATGRIQFDDRTMELSSTDYIKLTSMVFGQIDGPPKAALDVTSGGQTIPVLFEIREGSPSDATSEGEPDDD